MGRGGKGRGKRDAPFDTESSSESSSEDEKPAKGRGRAATTKGRGKGKDKAHAETESSSEDEEERRIDPEQGSAHTFREMAGLYKGRKTRSELQDYWETECRLLYYGGSKTGTKKGPSAAPLEESRPPPRKPIGAAAADKDRPPVRQKGSQPPARALSPKKEESVYPREQVQPVRKGGKGATSPTMSFDSAAAPQWDERRRDPEDGEVYSFDELATWYVGWYSRREIQEYWKWECTPVVSKKGKGKDGKGKDRSATDSKGRDGSRLNGRGNESDGKGKDGIMKGKGSQRSSTDNVAGWVCPDPDETRIDPSDGCAYSFEEIVAFYKAKLDRKALQAYWMNACQLIRSNRKGSGKSGGKPLERRAEHMPQRSRLTNRAPPPDDDFYEEMRPRRPRFYTASFRSTEEISNSMGSGGWHSTEVGDPDLHHSILQPGGRKVYPLYSDEGYDGAPTPLPMGLRVRAEELEDLLKDLLLMGGEGDFPGYAFALLPGTGIVQDALLDALGIRKAARREASVELTTWDRDFSQQQMGANLSRELRRATELLNKFGTTYELNFSELVTCAPVLYFAQSSTTDRPILGVIHSRIWH